MHTHVKESGTVVTGTDTVVRADDGNQYAAIAWVDGVTTFQRGEDGKPVVVGCDMDPEPAETKSDPEIESHHSTALAAFWSQSNRHPGKPSARGIRDDLAHPSGSRSLRRYRSVESREPADRCAVRMGASPNGPRTPRHQAADKLPHPHLSAPASVGAFFCPPRMP